MYCRSKVVEHDISSPLILRSPLYNNFPRRYGRFRVFQGIMSPPYFVMQYFRNYSGHSCENCRFSYTYVTVFMSYPGRTHLFLLTTSERFSLVRDRNELLVVFYHSTGRPFLPALSFPPFWPFPAKMVKLTHAHRPCHVFPSSLKVV